MLIQELVAAQREHFRSGVTLDPDYRATALLLLHNAILKQEKELCAALREDLGKSVSESYMTEIGMILSELTCQINHVKRWSRPWRRHTPLAQFWAKSYELPSPYGCVLVMSPWNYPLQLSLEPAIDAIAAGNTVVIKPSAYAPATSAAIKSLIGGLFDPAYAAVVEGGREVNTGLLDEPFDYIFFTGGKTVGRQVMQRAAARLTPVTLELGGKSPCIVEESANLKVAAQRIAFGKFLNVGQTCVAPDYLLVQSSVKERFLPLLFRAIEAQYGTKPLENPDYGSIINRKHFERITALYEHQPLLFGGERDEAALRIAPTVLEATLSSPAMGEEIFGPVLPVLTFDRVEELPALVEENPTPLACYLFTERAEVKKRLLDGISFGGGCVNDTIIHLATSEMGFGGVGQSGMGAYHGKKGFDTFTHVKSIVDKNTLIDLKMRYQPYSNQKLRLIRQFLK
ncbi:MAG: aldehyde dehydrogenase [Oscillospiraceae bacterium]|nr:aldehyde dehydrogenase [Oscillospiraceae bacterium]